MTERPWTKARVLKAYAEWAALERRAQNVVEAHGYATGIEDRRYDFEHLALPGWWGTGWPGDKFEWIGYDSDFCQPDYPLSLPIEYLWSDKEIEALRVKHEAFLESEDGRKQEAQERAEYERLKARFEGHAQQRAENAGGER